MLIMAGSYTFASIVIPIVAQVLPSWQVLLLLASLPKLLVIFSYKIIPESPSWLLCKGKIDEAQKMLEVVAKVNGNGKV